MNFNSSVSFFILGIICAFLFIPSYAVSNPVLTFESTNIDDPLTVENSALSIQVRFKIEASIITSAPP